MCTMYNLVLFYTTFFNLSLLCLVHLNLYCLFILLYLLLLLLSLACNLTCSAGYTVKCDCTDCDLTSICDMYE